MTIAVAYAPADVTAAVIKSRSGSDGTDAIRLRIIASADAFPLHRRTRGSVRAGIGTTAALHKDVTLLCPCARAGALVAVYVDWRGR